MYMHQYWNPVYTPFGSGFFGFALPLILIAVAITILLKGFALWYAARGGQKWWFIALLVINTLGILEVIYLLFFRPSAPYKHAFHNATKNAPPVDDSSHSA